MNAARFFTIASLTFGAVMILLTVGAAYAVIPNRRNRGWGGEGVSGGAR